MILYSNVFPSKTKQENFKHPCLVIDTGKVIYLTMVSHKTSINDISNQEEMDAVVVSGPNAGFFVKELNLEYCEPYYGTITLMQAKG